MTTSPRTCATCRFHTRLEDSKFLLCTLPPECAPTPTDAEDDAYHWRDREEMMATYIGTSCDVMRRMGAMCGPRGNLWTDRKESP